MSLELINVGAEANDGTGDTPRAAGVKINAAIATLNNLPPAPDYSADIAALEAVQGSQGAAILALESDVADLQAAPASPSGWDYIGPTEPIAPAVGFTWWEKPGQKTWYWTGSVWASTQLTNIPLPNSPTGSGFSGQTVLTIRYSQIPFPRALAIQVNSGVLVTTVPEGSRWDVSVGFGVQQSGLSTLVGSFAITEVTQRKGRVEPLNGLNLNPDHTCIYWVATPTGSPGGLILGSSVLIREVRTI